MNGPDELLARMPPQEIIEAAELVGRWFAERNIKGWKLGRCADRFDTLTETIAAEQEQQLHSLRTFKENAIKEVTRLRAANAALAARCGELERGLQFYAKHIHWMALTSDVDASQKLLIANGDTVGTDGWCVAEQALASQAEGK